MGYDTDRMDLAGVVTSNKSASYLARLFFLYIGICVRDFHPGALSLSCL